MKTVSKKSKIVMIIGGVLFILLLCAGWYMNSSGFLGASDSNAAFLPSTCSQGRACGAGEKSVCLPTKCVCKHGGSVVMAKANSNVCVPNTDKYVKCQVEDATKTDPKVKKMADIREDLARYLKELGADSTSSHAVKSSIRSLISSLDKSISSVGYKSKVDGCKYLPPHNPLSGDMFSCEAVCNIYSPDSTPVANKPHDTGGSFNDLKNYKPSQATEKEITSHGYTLHYSHDGTKWHYTLTGASQNCEDVSVNHFVAESFPEQITINVSVTHKKGSACTGQHKQISKSGAIDASHEASVNLVIK